MLAQWGQEGCQLLEYVVGIGLAELSLRTGPRSSFAFGTRPLLDRVGWLYYPPVKLDDERSGQILHKPRGCKVVANLHQVHRKHLHHIDTLGSQSIIEVSQDSILVLNLTDAANLIRKLQYAMSKGAVLQSERIEEVGW